MPDEIPSSARNIHVDKGKVRDWFKVRKYVINRIRDGTSQAQAARWAGVSVGFVSKWWNRWQRNKSWETLRSRPTTPKRVRIKKWFYAEEIVEAKRAHPELGAQKIKALLGIDLSHQKVYEMLVEEGAATSQALPAPDWWHRTFGAKGLIRPSRF